MSEMEAMTCREVVELLSRYLDGELDEEQRTRIEDHLMACEGCRLALAQLRQVLRLTGMLREEDLSPEYRDALVRAFRTWRAEVGG